MIDPIAARGALVAAGTVPVTGSMPPLDADANHKLRDAARQLEGVFVQQLFKALRDSVPQQDGIVSANAGEEMFTGLLDQHLAAETPLQWNGGLAEAIYRQMRDRAATEPPQSFARLTTR
jgi:flagellar protein FlgJ